jgi:hypothetical protein
MPLSQLGNDRRFTNLELFCYLPAMFIKICAGVCAVSTFVTAAIALWFTIGMVSCTRELKANVEQMNDIGVTSELEMKKQDDEIKRRLDSLGGSRRFKTP